MFLAFLPILRYNFACIAIDAAVRRRRGEEPVAQEKKRPVQRLAFCRGDLAVLTAILLTAAGLGLLFLFRAAGGGAVTVEIRQDGELLCALPLDREESITVTGEYENVVTIRDGKVWMASSTCPGEDCVHAGPISAPGRSIVCLPNRVEVRLVGGGSGSVDMVVG